MAREMLLFLFFLSISSLQAPLPVLHTEKRSLARLRVLGGQGRVRVGHERVTSAVEAALRHAQGQAWVERGIDPNSHKFTK